MLRYQLTLAAFLITAIVPQQDVVSLVPIPTQQPQESSTSPQSSQKSGLPEVAADPLPSPVANAKQEEKVQAEVAEIMAIRERLGGGVAEALGDLSLEMPGSKPKQGESAKKPPLNYEDEFAQFLAERSRTAQPPRATSHTPQQNARESRLRQHAGLQERILPMDSIERRESIRHAARMLEEAAAALEEAGVYDRADQIRQTATELWRSAR